ncbi:hypothetical protein AB1N83_013775, partial [Pleurotus pulmonarius]
VALMVS